jgi:hypothetical protein
MKRRPPARLRCVWLLGLLWPFVVALSTGVSCASPLPATSAPVVAAGPSLPETMSPPLPRLKLGFPSATLAQGLYLVAQADLPAPDAEPAPPVFPPAKADWPGLMRDTGYLIGYQFLGFLILYVAPESVSNWSEEDKEHYDFKKWMHNVTHPTVDEDKWWINYILHPYWGSAYFLDARGRGFGRWGSFWYSFFASNLYEFGTEAFAEEASVQDIFVTPIGGALLGMALEDTWRTLVLKGESRSSGESVLLYLISPLGEVNHDVDRLFGFDTSRTAVNILPVIGPVPGHGTYAGIQLSLRW